MLNGASAESMVVALQAVGAVSGLSGDVFRVSSQRFAVYQSAAHCHACFLEGYRMGLINQTSFGRIWGCLDAAAMLAGSVLRLPLVVR